MPEILSIEGKRPCLCYNPNYGNYVRILSLGEALLETSGVVNILCTSYLKAVGFYGFSYHAASNPENLAIDRTMFDGEVVQIFDSVYVNAITSRVSILDTLYGTSICYRQIKDKYDELPVHLAERLEGVVFCTDWWEAAYAYFYSVPFIFLIQSREQIEKFWEKIQRLCLYIRLYLIRFKENENI